MLCLFSELIHSIWLLCRILSKQNPKTFWNAPTDSEPSSTFDQVGLTFKLYYVSVLDLQRQQLFILLLLLLFFRSQPLPSQSMPK